MGGTIIVAGVEVVWVFFWDSNSNSDKSVEGEGLFNWLQASLASVCPLVT